MAEVRRLEINVIAETSQAEKNLKSVDKAADQAAGGLDDVGKSADKASTDVSKVGKAFGITTEQSKKFAKQLGLVAVAAGAIAVAVGTKAVKEFAAFEQRLSDVSTLLAGDSTEAIGKFDAGIKELLKTVPKSADDLGASAYQIVSAGITDADEALTVLKESSELAVAGLGTTEEATNLLTTALNAFNIPADQAAETSDILFKTVAAGKTDISQLSQAFGKMAGNAVSAGVSLVDVQAATAAISAVTGKTSETQNALAQVFLELTVAGGKLDKGLQSNGSSLQALNDAIAEKGLVGGFEQVRDELGLTDTEFKNLFSSAEGGTAVFQLLTSANEGFVNSQTDMTEGANKVREAFEKQQETVQAQYQLFQNELNVALINLGEVVLPVAIAAMGALSDVIALIQPTIELLANNLDIVIPILIGVGTAIFTALLPAMGALITSIGAAVLAASPFIALGVAISVAVYAIIKVVQNWGTIMEVLKGIVSSVLSAVGAAFNAVKNAISGVISSISSGLKSFASAIQSIWTRIVNFTKANWDKIRIILLAIAGPIGLVIGYWNELKAGIEKVIKGIFNFLSNTLPRWLSIAKQFGENLIKGVANLPAEFLRIAGEMIDGFIQGVKNKITGAVNAVKEFAGSVAGAAKSVLGIQSPSRVFRELGNNTAEGFLLGIEDESEEAQAVMREFVEGLQAEAKDAQEPLDFTGAFQELEQVVSDAFDEASAAITDFVQTNADAQQQLRDEIAQTEQEIKDLEAAFAEANLKAEQQFQETAAGIVLDAKEKEAEIQEQINKLKSEAAEQEKAPDPERLARLQEELAAAQAILETQREQQIVTQEQLAEEERLRGLNALERLQEEYLIEQEIRQQRFEEEKAELEARQEALQVSLDAREAEFEAFYTNLTTQDQAFTEVYNTALAQREATTAASINRLIAHYNRLAAAKRAAGFGDGGFTSADAVTSAVGFAKGGLTGIGKLTDVAGVVHKGEWVAPNWMLKKFGQVFSNLERIRRRGFEEGGFTSPAPVSNNYNQPINIKVKANSNADYNAFARYLSWELRRS